MPIPKNKQLNKNSKLSRKGKLPKRVILESAPKLILPNTKKSSVSLRQKLFRASIGIAVGASAIFGGKAVLKNRAEIENQRVGIEQVIKQEKLVKDPKQWSRISMIYNWNPLTAEGIAKISFVEKISEKTGVSPKDVLITLEQNRFSKTEAEQRIWEIRNSMRNDSNVERARKERIIKIIQLASRESIAEVVERDLKSSSGSLHKLKKLN